MFGMHCSLRRGCALTVLLFSLATSSAQAQVQNVFVDFATFTGGTDFVYTVAEQDQVIAKANTIYGNFNINFFRTDPGGSRIVVSMNNGGAGGLASDIDFRNLSLTGTADVNINGVVPSTPRSDFIGISGTVVAHEVGHLVGLRHYDSFGAYGQGRAPGVPAGNFLPSYPGPALATETGSRIMASPGSVGQTIPQAIGNMFVSERESVKLTIAGLARNGQPALATIAETGAAHATAATAQAFSLTSINVPNSLPVGALNANKTFLVDSAVVTGSVTVAGQIDFYSFNATAGEVFYIEVISSAPNRITNSIDSIVTFTDSLGITLNNYYGTAATNDDNFEDTDSTMFDYIISSTGTQFLKVNAFLGTDTGDYELLVYRLAAVAVPEPATVAFLGLTAIGAFLGYRRWQTARNSDWNKKLNASAR